MAQPGFGGRAFHPGEALREDYLPDYGWTPEELAERLRVPVEVVREVLAERAPVTPELALRLGRLFDQGGSFWMNLQLRYDAKHSPAARDILRIEPVEEIRKAG
ncbi:MAG TPA: HigA family addiction module antitoxin [Longimicrobium sp.]|nr:HigA family addiction module antitoxin [Longimicrobium sp.]